MRLTRLPQRAPSRHSRFAWTFAAWAASSLTLARVAAAETGVERPAAATTSASMAVDPVGDYQWSFPTADFAVNGTLSVTRKDSVLAGSFTSDQTPDATPAKNVSFDGKRLTATAVGDFGEFTVLIDIDDSGVTATYKLAQADGSVSSGPLSVKRAPK
jgi:hypothetical protein